VATLYDRVRPTYPPALVGNLVDLCGIRPYSRILEIGPGTGQLTTALAQQGSPLRTRTPVPGQLGACAHLQPAVGQRG